MESEAMLWVRRVRDENSARHIKMTPAERKAEADEAIARLEKATGRKVICMTPEEASKKNSYL